jgi:diguanylate cyclase (GGDEF)-like protein
MATRIIKVEADPRSIPACHGGTLLPSLRPFGVAMLLALLPGGARLHAQEAIAQGRFTFRAYGTEQGLGNQAVQCLAQDTTGFLWVGTEDGLYRYDGRRFQSYGTGEGLPSSYVTALKEDGKGHLWVATFQGLAEEVSGRFVAVGAAQGLPEGPVQGLDADGTGRMWVAFAQGPYMQREDGGFAPVPGWAGGQLTAIASPGDSVWTASLDDGVARIRSRESGRWRNWEGAFGADRIDAIVQDAKGEVWARDAHHLWVLRRGQARFEDAAPGVLPPTSAKALLRADPGGGLLVPTDRGLWTLQDGRWSSLQAVNGLPTPYVRDALRDREGSLWIGSMGVFRLLGRGLWRAYTAADGLPDSVVWTIFRDRDRRLYVGTDRGLAVAGPEGWKAVPATVGKVIRTAVQAADGSFYLGSAPSAVYHWDPRSGGIDGVYGTAAGLGGSRIFRLLLDPEGMLWAATEDAGLFRADTRRKPLRFERVDLPAGTRDEYVNGLTQGASGRVYACGEHGLAVLSAGKWRRYTDKDGLKQTHVAYALELRDGSVLVGYFESMGLSRIRFRADGSLEAEAHPVQGDRLDHEKIYMLGQDSQGRIWAGTGRGVFLIQDGIAQHFGLSEGLVGEDIDNMAFLADPGGDVWVGSSSGLARFDAGSYQGPPAPPGTAFLSCALGEQGFDPSLPGPEVPHRDGTLMTRFSGMSFLGEGRTHSEARLEGLEAGWHGADSGEARYPALAGGTYTFRVRSKVGDGPWGPESSFSFTVRPPWWETWWFRTLAALATAGLVAVFIGWRVASLRRRNEELAELVRARTSELEAANEALQSQSVTDSLTGLKNRRYLGVCMPEDSARVRRTHRELLDHRLDRSHVNIDLVLVMVDLDHFKEVNDTYGHAAGDLVLQQVALILKEATRDSDTVVRWGGEEFLVVARNAARKEAIVLVERIRSRMAAHAFDIGDGRVLRRTCSIGFALMPFLCAEPDFMNWEEVVDVADQCLYVAKHAGRDAWVGVMTRKDAVSADMGPKLAQRLHEIVRNSQVEVLTSHPDPSKLPWDGA